MDLPETRTLVQRYVRERPQLARVSAACVYRTLLVEYRASTLNFAHLMQVLREDYRATGMGEYEIRAAAPD